MGFRAASSYETFFGPGLFLVWNFFRSATFFGLGLFRVSFLVVGLFSWSYFFLQSGTFSSLQLLPLCLPCCRVLSLPISFACRRQHLQLAGAFRLGRIILSSATGTRTQVARVKAEYPNQLDYIGLEFKSGLKLLFNSRSQGAFYF